MLFDSYEEKQLLININFKARADADNTFGYRGELVLIEGEVADAHGRKKAPHAVVRNGVFLSVDGKLQFASGCLDHLEQLCLFVEKYKADFAADMGALFFVVDITKPMQVELEGVNFILLPLLEGIAWNELLDVLGLDKGDFKGQSSAQKIVTAYNDFKSYKSKGEVLTLDAARAFVSTELKREGYGAI
ncbi:MAG: hypothetical protein COS35_01875 [Zetaproteobacteria bacterium CG02_land_8_20_14_3_00_50_9]|nr:MAG: hypothetical protein COW62_02475 [Zetaproteobacteria bacterium CG17_big_fil_post_rev_8_21_14_2_50_50_13]PIV31345.1 MAG: hypothetical protein COS35_01875 [Zetaproteobacteria bacterium CG02_land_8_20_14_3_00_50_9]PIY56465.1 MAG: hypothetical protein COZ00_04040 [Zetaproteobacteria bacterium CG_4_10_14_0_8_um_filter_49_80]